MFLTRVRVNYLVVFVYYLILVWLPDCQYQRNRLPGKAHSEMIYYVEWDVKLYTLNLYMFYTELISSKLAYVL